MNNLRSIFQNRVFALASSSLSSAVQQPSSSVVTIAVRHMSKYLSNSATKRLPLTTKRARKGYYKGKGGTKEGHLTSKAKFIVNKEKRLNLMVPDLEGFKLKPYIAHGVSKFSPEIRRA